MAKTTTAAIPIPIPAFAPLERTDDGPVAVFEAVVDEVWEPAAGTDVELDIELDPELELDIDDVLDEEEEVSDAKSFAL